MLRAAGFLLFAFAGYERIATVGEEVVDPSRTLPREIAIALGLTLVVYAAVLVGTLMAAGSAALGASPAPLADAIRVGRFPSSSAPGAALASLGVLLSLLVGVSRTTFAMAAARDLPRWLAAVHPRHQVPHRAEAAVGAAVIGLLAIADVGDAIGFSSFNVLVYYAVANAAALRLYARSAGGHLALAALGLGGCARLVAASLPRAAVVGGLAVLGAGLLAFAIMRAVRRGSTPR